MNWHNTPIHILDFEGNGRSGVVEFGVATVFGGEVVAARTEFCRPQGRIPRREVELHGITNQAVAHAQPLKSYWEYFADFETKWTFGGTPRLGRRKFAQEDMVPFKACSQLFKARPMGLGMGAMGRYQGALCEPFS